MGVAEADAPAPARGASQEAAHGVTPAADMLTRARADTRLAPGLAAGTLLPDPVTADLMAEACIWVLVPMEDIHTAVMRTPRLMLMAQAITTIRGMPLRQPHALRAQLIGTAIRSRARRAIPISSSIRRTTIQTSSHIRRRSKTIIPICRRIRNSRTIVPINSSIRRGTLTPISLNSKFDNQSAISRSFSGDRLRCFWVYRRTLIENIGSCFADEDARCCEAGTLREVRSD
jgi:hypothetical protein